jgi:hypothetical protein
MQKSVSLLPSESRSVSFCISLQAVVSRWSQFEASVVVRNARPPPCLAARRARFLSAIDHFSICPGTFLSAGQDD